jgi:hypothetical protein
LIYEFAITPGVFDPSLCGNREQWELQLRYLAKGLMIDGLVADLQGGQWSQFIHTQQIAGTLHLKAKELLRKLRENNRLRLRVQCNTTACFLDPEWLSEAIGSHEQEAFQGIITAHTTREDCSHGDHVQSIEKIHESPWWTGRSHSKVLTRYAQDYLEALRPILRQANSLMFIDAHIDPNEPRYLTIPEMISIAVTHGHARPQPKIEIHRVCYEGRGENRTFPTQTDWIQRFHSGDWGRYTYEVFIWDDFHDRHLISDLCAIQLGAGFDASSVPVLRQTTTWTRLDRQARDQVQREFDSASNIHRLRYRFRVN